MYGLGVIMTCNNVPLWNGVLIVCGECRQAEYGNPVLSAQFCCGPKTALKNIFIFLNIKYIYTVYNTVYKIKSIKFFCLAGVAQWIEHGLQTKGSLVRFPVRAHAWVAGQVPSGGHVRGNHILMFLSLFFSPVLLKTEANQTVCIF